MDITWLGGNSFKINDGIIDVIINPSDKAVQQESLTDDTVFLCTEINNDYQTKLIKVESPGEYEINNASIHGVANSVIREEDRFISTCYRIESRGLSISVVGMIGSPFDAETLSVLASSHVVLFSPDNRYVDSEILANNVRSIESRKILISGFDKTNKKPSKNLEAITKVLGIKDYEPKNKASFTISSFGDAQEIIILEN